MPTTTYSMTGSLRGQARTAIYIECWVADAPLSEGLNTGYVGPDFILQSRLATRDTVPPSLGALQQRRHDQLQGANIS